MNERELFVAALHITDPVARAAFLDQACGADQPLRDRVRSLLLEHDEMGSFLDAPAAAHPAGTGMFRPPAAGATHTFGLPSAEPTADYPGREQAGAVIGGKYTLVEPIGEGGMGAVWRAKQTEPVKRFVAVKVIKAGMDSKQVLARFEAERQALALMDHPNIAKVLDGGLHEGRPYFVMELVKGVPITEYCDAHRLTPRERLELFVPVCQAIQHAHQKGVIHRDIKPSNVLVALYDDKPVMKVIDFGVAKATGAALTERTIDTGVGGVVGTPEYMSPEQATFNNLDIDTRSDVYALGVLLYELLTGSPPFARRELEKRGLLEMLRVVREVEPPRPSTKLSTADALPTLSANRGTEPKKLTGLLRNELDWIVMKALEKDRTRRYETANGFAADVLRYLSGEAVQAHPPSAGYRLKKFVRRNKGRVLAASLVLLVLLGGIAGTTLGLIEARRQEQEAKEQERIAREESVEKEKARAAEAERVKERDAALKAEAERADDLRHRLGVNAMVLANAAYDSRFLKLAAERLDAVPAGQRGWEWRYLRRQLDGGIFTLYGHAAPVRSVAFSPDGTRVVTGAGGGQTERVEAKVWDARTGAHLFDLKGFPGGPGTLGLGTLVAYSADGTRILTAGGDSKPRVWGAATGELRLELDEPPRSVTCAALSPDGTRIALGLAAGAFGLVKVFDARTGAPVRHWRAPRFASAQLAYSPDGKQILGGGIDYAARLWDAETGATVLTVKGVVDHSCNIAFSPDGTRFVTGRGNMTAQVIDARTGEILLVLRGRPRESPASQSFLPMGVLGVAFSPDGTRIVTVGAPTGVGSGEATVWDARTGAELLELRGHAGSVACAAFSPDGQRIVTGGYDRTAKVWDARTGTPRLELTGIKSGVESAAMSADGQWIVTSSGVGSDVTDQPGEATIWDVRTGAARHVLKGLKGPVKCVAISRDGTRVVTGGGTPGEERVFPTAPPGMLRTVAEATVWDGRTGKALFALKGLKEPVGSVALSPDETRIITAAHFDPAWTVGAELKVWDATNGTLLHDLSQPVARTGLRLEERGGSVAFSPDGARFVTGGVRNGDSMGSEVKVRDVRTGQVLVGVSLGGHVALGVAYSRDGTRIATAHSGKGATVRDAATGEPLVELKGHTGNVYSVAFSPDGTRVVTGGADRTVRVWDVRTGVTLAELKAHSGAVMRVSFSADGSQILTAGRSARGRGEVFVWDAPTRISTVALAAGTSIFMSAVFSPDGTRVATASQDGTVRVWDARTGGTLHELKWGKGGGLSLAFSADGTRIASGGHHLTVKVWDARTGAELEIKTGPHKNCAFSTDGTRIVTEDFQSNRKTWDARTGQELTGEAIPETVRCGPVSTDGRFFVHLTQDRVEVIPRVPSPEELADRRLHTAPNPSLHRAGYLAARVAKDDFAAAFYLNLFPADERKALVEQGDAANFGELNRLVAVHQHAGKLDEAVPLLVEILKFNKARLGPRDPATIQTAGNLARIYHQMGQYEKSIPLLEEVVRHLQAKQDPQTQGAQVELGMAYKDAGRLKQAIAVLEEAAAKEESVRQQFGEGYWSQLLDVCALAGEHARIVAVCQEQLKILRTKQDEEGLLEYPKADLLARLGRAYLAQQKWSDAEPHLRECVTIREKVVPEDWATFEILSLLGEVLSRQKKYAEAEPLLLKGYKGLKQREYSLGPKDEPRLPEALDRMIEFYTATNKPDEAKKWQTERAKHPTPKEVAPPPRTKG